MISHLGIFKRKYRWTVLVGKGGKVYYTGGVSVSTGFLPGPNIHGILKYVKDRDAADSVHIISIGRTFESPETPLDP